MKTYTYRVEVNNDGETQYSHPVTVESEIEAYRMNPNRVCGYGGSFSQALANAKAFLVKLKALELRILDSLIHLNNNRGRGEIENVTFNHANMTGTFEQVCQYRKTSVRVFRFKTSGRVFALGSSKKV